MAVPSRSELTELLKPLISGLSFSSFRIPGVVETDWSFPWFQKQAFCSEAVILVL
jgi:hypothetical protein